MTVNWGFLGASRIGRRSLAPAVIAAGHRLAAVASRDPGRADAFAAAFGAPRTYATYAELIDDPDIDAIYIALPNDAHVLWTLRALEAGKHVLCEKPLALSAAEVAQMQHSEQRSGRLVMEAFCPPFHPQFARAQQAIQAGGIGRLVSMHAWFANAVPDTSDFRWAPALGGGALYDLGGYCVSAMRWLAGTPLLRVAAMQQCARGVDASFSGLLTFADEVLGQFGCSFAAARSQSLTLLGTAGQIAFDAPFSGKDRATTLTINGVAEVFAPLDPYAAMVAQFGHSIGGHGPSPLPLADSLVQARALDALFAAADSGRTIAL